MSEPPSSATTDAGSAQIIRPPLQLVRLPVDKPQPAVAFLQKRSAGVMELIAHFWERLAQTPPLLRADLHLVVATPIASEYANINIPQLDHERFSGAMLYVPKAHRADVLALDPETAAGFASYIHHQGLKSAGGEPAPVQATPNPDSATPYSTLALTDLSTATKNGAAADTMELPTGPAVVAKAAGGNNNKVPIDFLTGTADGIAWMTPLLLPLVHKRQPARQLVNVVMQLPAEKVSEANGDVRLATAGDVAALNRWRRLYKEERGILFDADMNASIQHQRIYVYEAKGQVVAVAKLDLDLQGLVEIGGVYTFPEFRNRGYGEGIVKEIARRIRASGRVPRLQVDVNNVPALRMYEKGGWVAMGNMARVWLTG